MNEYLQETENIKKGDGKNSTPFLVTDFNRSIHDVH